MKDLIQVPSVSLQMRALWRNGKRRRQDENLLKEVTDG